MIKLKYAQFMSESFSLSVQQLTQGKYPSELAWKIRLMVDKMQKQRTLIQSEYLVLVGLFASKDAEGKLIVPEGSQPGAFDVPEDRMAAYKAEVALFNEREFTINVSQLTLRDVAKVEFTPAEIDQLAPLFVESTPVAEPQGSGPALAPVLPIGGVS